MSCTINYNKSTGRLLDYTSPMYEEEEPTPEVGSLHFSEGVTSAVLYTHYTDGASLLVRPEMKLQYYLQGEVNKPWQISQIPVGTEVKFPNGSMVVDDGYIEWYSAVPGEFLFTLTNFPYADATVNATIT